MARPEFRNRPIQKFACWSDFWSAFPTVGHRLHTLSCDTHQGEGLTQEFTYEGTEFMGFGTYCFKRQYGSKSGTFRVWNGKITAFKRTQDMRKPSRMKLEGNWSIYTGREVFVDDDGKSYVAFVHADGTIGERQY